MHLFCSLLVLYLTMCEHLEMFLFHWHFTFFFFFFPRHQRRSKRAEKKILSNAASGQNLGAQTGLQAKSTAETCYSGVCVRVWGGGTLKWNVCLQVCQHQRDSKQRPPQKFATYVRVCFLSFLHLERIIYLQVCQHQQPESKQRLLQTLAIQVSHIIVCNSGMSHYSAM